MRHRARRVIAVVALTASCGGGVDGGAEAGRPALERSTLLSALVKGEAGDRADATSLHVDLGGFNWFQEIRLGSGWVAVVLSRNLEGELFLFSGEELRSRERTSEPISATARDLDGDSVAEILLETFGHGTGVRIDAYEIYSVQNSALLKVWSDWASWRLGTETGRAFLRIEPVWGKPEALLTYESEGTRYGQPAEGRRSVSIADGKVVEATPNKSLQWTSTREP